MQVVIEVADEVLAEEAEDETTRLVTLVEADDWRHVLRHRAQAGVLTVAEDHGARGVAELVQGLREASGRGEEVTGADLGALCDPGPPTAPTTRLPDA